MSSKRGFLNRSAALAVVVGFAVLVCAIPLRLAIADSWKHHHGDYDGWKHGPRYVVPGYAFGGYYAPPPVVYYPPAPAYVVVPPPVIYAPAPAYYGPPSLNFGITLPLQ